LVKRKNTYDPVGIGSEGPLGAVEKKREKNEERTRRAVDNNVLAMVPKGA